VITDEHGCFHICGWTLLAPIFTVSVAPPDDVGTTRRWTCWSIACHRHYFARGYPVKSWAVIADLSRLH
jgi:hypothetical protein